jgi:hypothetical protein
MRIKIQLFKDASIFASDIPFKTYQFRIKKNNEVEPTSYLIRKDEVQDQLQYFLEDYAHLFIKLKKDEKSNSKD